MIYNLLIIIGFIFVIIHYSRQSVMPKKKKELDVEDLFSGMWNDRNPWVGTYRDNSIPKYN